MGHPKKSDGGLKGRACLLWLLLPKASTTISETGLAIQVGFYCGQSAVIFLEANPQVRIIGFDDFSYAAGEACYHHLQHKYPGRINVYRGDSRETIPAFIEEHWANGVYTGPVCDLIRTDARPEYPLRRQDFSLLQPMTSCSTLILFNDVCDIQNCHLYQVGEASHLSFPRPPSTFLTVLPATI